MKLNPALNNYILHWGEMGTRWGVNRTVAQIHALLYISPEPLQADEISETLSVARSNVSTSLKELRSFGLIKVVHKIGDRRDHFEAVDEIWELFFLIIEERKRRELDPVVEILQQCVTEAKQSKDINSITKSRIKNMLVFVEDMDRWYGEIKKIPAPTLKKLMCLGSTIAKYVRR